MGPTAGLILADLGADVIKVEPASGDTTRRLVGFAAGFFGTFNRNKRSLAVDLKSDEGRALLHRLAATADVVDRKLRARHHGPARLRLRRFRQDKSAAGLLRAQGLSQRPLRASPGARRGRAIHGRPRLHDRPAGPAAARRRLRRRHHGRHVRGDRHPGGVARARAHRPRPARQIGAVRIDRLPDGAAHGRRRR